jgi:hypothetical protein
VHTTCDSRRARGLLDRVPFRAVADEEQGDELGPGQRGDRLVDRVEPAEAPDPAHHEAVAEPEPGAYRGAVGVGSEHRGVDPGRGDHDPARVDTEPDDLLDHRVGAARDDVGALQGRSLTPAFDRAAPSRPLHPPLPGLPHVRRRDEHDRGNLQRCCELEPGAVEELVALPHEDDVVPAPRARTLDVEGACPPVLAYVLPRGLRRRRARGAATIDPRARRASARTLAAGRRRP